MSKMHVFFPMIINSDKIKQKSGFSVLDSDAKLIEAMRKLSKPIISRPC